MPDFDTVDAYIAAQAAVAQPMLRQLRDAVRAAIPKAEEHMSNYNLPVYRLDGRAVTYIGAAKKHCALYAIYEAVRDQFPEELAPYGDISKGTIRFPLDQPLPKALVKKLVRAVAADRKGAKR